MSALIIPRSKAFCRDRSPIVNSLGKILILVIKNKSDYRKLPFAFDIRSPLGSFVGSCKFGKLPSDTPQRVFTSNLDWSIYQQEEQESQARSESSLLAACVIWVGEQWKEDGPLFRMFSRCCKWELINSLWAPTEWGSCLDFEGSKEYTGSIHRLHKWEN